MAVFILTNDIAACKVACMAADQLGINDFSFKLTVTSGGPTYEMFLTEMNLQLAPLYLALLPPLAFYHGLSVQRVIPTKTQPFTIADPQAGETTGDLIPRQAAAIISKKGTNAGRTGRGRVYIPFLSDAIVGDSGHINTLGRTNLTALAVAIFTERSIDFGGGDVVTITPVIQNTLTPYFNEITAYAVRTKIATQKRRGDYGKPNSAPW